MLKVLLTATMQSHIGQFHKPLVEMLRQQGEVEVHVAAYDNLAEKNGLSLDFADRVFSVPFARSPFSPRNGKAYRLLKQIIREGGYDIVHCNTPVGGVLTRLAARKSGAKVFYTAHGFHFYTGAPKRNWLLYYPVEKWLAPLCERLITINQEDYLRAKDAFATDVRHIHGVGVDEQRFHPISETETVALKEKLGFSATQRILLCVGELLPNKNQSMAITAMKQVLEQHPQTVLLLAGNGPERSRLEMLAAQLGISEQVHFLDYVLNLEEYQRISDISLSCSNREGLGLNIIEALLSGTPVVATENRGHNELIHLGVNGYLVSRNDPDGLADVLIRLLGDEPLRQQLCHQAPSSVAKYTATAVKEELKAIYFGE